MRTHFPPRPAARARPESLLLLREGRGQRIGEGPAADVVAAAARRVPSAESTVERQLARQVARCWRANTSTSMRVPSPSLRR